MLQDLVGQLGRRFLDVLVGDALYLQAPFVKQVERLGLAWAFTLKENQPELLREAERCTQAAPPGVHQEPGQEIRYWHLPDLDWPVADRRVQSEGLAESKDPIPHEPPKNLAGRSLDAVGHVDVTGRTP
jgi:hypothetical protein